MDESVKGAWAQVENQLQRRYDLIPNYVETVKGYASHEKELFEMLDRSICYKNEPFCLKPKCPNFFIDNEYILYGMGLLSIKYPDKALRILKGKLKQIC